jgi:ankyrin repeat protein
VKFLIDKGANVNLKDNFDDTALHRACENCHLEIVELLLDH